MLCGVALHAQTVVSGVCLNASDNSPYVGCNVIAYDSEGKSILGFSTSDAEGKWEIKVRELQGADIRIAATGFNIEKTEMNISGGRYSGITLLVKEAKLSIKESVVKVEPIKQRGDTVTYNVSSFKSETDRTIADVLGRMPGIQVDESGGIKYHGRAISKFYVEGLDLMGAKYGIAAGSIKAEDVASVEVYERHQPIKSLRELVPSDDSALNLKLKQGAKGTWSGSGEAGLGYSPLLWKAGLTGMFFGRGFQTLDLYKGNNAGDRNGRMLKEQVRGLDALGEMVRVSIPFSPSVSEDRYLDFTEHALSGNALVKMKEDVTFRSNVSLVTSDELTSGSARSEYYFADGNAISYDESMTLRRLSRKLTFEGQVEKNSDRTFIRDNVRLNGHLNDEDGAVTDETVSSAQVGSHRYASIANDLYLTRRIGNRAVRFTSVSGYQNMPEMLDVGTAVQHATQGMLSSSNRAHMTMSRNSWTYDPSIVFNLTVHSLKSELERGSGIADNTLRNDRFASRTDFQIQNNIGWKPFYWFRLGVNIPLGVIAFVHDDRIREDRSSEMHCVSNPSIYNELDFGQKLGLTSRVGYSNVFEDDRQWSPGLMMNTYRTIRKSDKHSQTSGRVTAMSSLKYTEVTKSLFMNFDVTLMNEKRNYIMSSDYSDGYITDNVVAYDNESRTLQFSLGISKGISAILGNVDIRLDYMTGTSPYMRQGVVMDSDSDILSGTVGFTSAPADYIDIKYDAVSRYGLSTLGSYSAPSTFSIRQNLQFGIRILDNIWWQTGVQHYYSSLSGGNGQGIIFLDSGISMKQKRVEYSLTAKNLTNAKVMKTSYVNAANTHVQSVTLRPLSVIFKMEMSF